MKVRKRFVITRPGVETPESYMWARHPWSQLYTEMKPSTFAHLSAGGKEILTSREEWEGIYPDLCSRLREAMPVDPPRFVVDADTCKVLAHEGRHRATIASQCHIPRVPVILTCIRETLSPTDIMSGARYYEPLEAEQCMKCAKKLRPQRVWDTQHLMYVLHKRREK